MGTSLRPEVFHRNRDAFRESVKEINDALQNSQIPSEDTLAKQHNRGRLHVRERIDILIDSGSEFLELSSLAGFGMHEGVQAGAGVITGVARVQGMLCMIIANDSTVKGGTYFPISVKKHLRAQEIALKRKLPCISLVDSGGAFLPLQDEVFPDRDHFGRIFYNQAQMSERGIPQIAVVLGSCTAGGAYVPAMSDQVIMVEDQATIFLGGPPLVKAATGEEIDAENLGGARVHTQISGVADYLEPDEESALRKAREVVKNLGRKKGASLHSIPAKNPSQDAAELSGLIPADPKQAFPMRDVLDCVLDASSFEEFKAEYGKTLITGFARIGGYLVGIIANDGILFSESALKGAHFIQLCEQRSIPLLFLHNIVGFMVGKEYEHGGIAKNGAKMVTAVSCCKVPKLSLIVGGSFGAGNYAMAGRAYSPDFLFMWPNARISVMGPEQAAAVLTQVKSDSMQKKGTQWNPDEKEAYEQKIKQGYQEQAHALYSTARLWDDGIIFPEQTRRVLTQCLDIIHEESPEQTSSYGVFRM